MRCVHGLICGMLATAAGLPAAFAAEPAEPEHESYTERIPGTDVEFEMVAIPGGEFLMGSPRGEGERDEGPQVHVEAEPFWMGKFEVTWEEYVHFLEEYIAALHDHRAHQDIPEDRWADAVSLPTPVYVPALRQYPGLRSEDGKYVAERGRPAVNMTQLAAKQYTKWLSQKTGRFYRLPTEAEWEYAARAGTETAYHFGDDPAQLDAYAWYFDNANDTTQAVGQKEPNPWGLHDMHGNVAEWVIDQYYEDWYGRFPRSRLNQYRPERTGPFPAADLIAWPRFEYPRVVRGGSWRDEPEDLRSARRLHSDPQWKEMDAQLPRSIWWQFVGFRIVRPVNEPSEEEKLRVWEPDVPRLEQLLYRRWDKEVRILIDSPQNDHEQRE